MSGSGCSSLAKLMAMPKDEFLKTVRKPSMITPKEASETDNDRNFQRDNQGVNNKALGSLVFKRKYTICYNFAQENYQPYQVVKYTHVVWLFILLWIKRYCNLSSPDDLKGCIFKILIDKYKPSVDKKDDEYKQYLGCLEDNYNMKTLIFQHFIEIKR